MVTESCRQSSNRINRFAKLNWSLLYSIIFFSWFHSLISCSSMTNKKNPLAIMKTLVSVKKKILYYHPVKAEITHPENPSQHATQPLTPLQVASEFGKTQQWGKLNKTLTCPTQQGMFWTKSNLTFVVAGQEEVQAGQVNLRGIVPRSGDNVLQTYVAPCSPTYADTSCIIL